MGKPPKLVHGCCVYDSRLIVYGESLNEDDLEMLDTLIHEMIHAEMPHESEKTVRRTASEIAKALFRIGYRVKK